MSQISSEGLIGPPNGLRSLSYEFCIPQTQAAIRDLRLIDPTIQYYRQSPGRIGCDETEYLCIGETHNPRWKEILEAIANLPYVEKIQQSFAE